MNEAESRAFRDRVQTVYLALVLLENEALRALIEATVRSEQQRLAGEQARLEQWVRSPARRAAAARYAERVEAKVEADRLADQRAEGAFERDLQRARIQQERAARLRPPAKPVQPYGRHDRRRAEERSTIERRFWQSFMATTDPQARADLLAQLRRWRQGRGPGHWTPRPL